MRLFQQAGRGHRFYISRATVVPSLRRRDLLSAERQHNSKCGDVPVDYHINFPRARYRVEHPHSLYVRHRVG